MVNETGATGAVTRAARKQATGEAVLEAARAEFERVGYEAASLRAIAARAGVSAGTVLHHHGDKRELLHSALFADLEAALQAAIASIGERPLEVELDALARAVFRYYERRPGLSRTLLRESLFADPPWAERFAGQARDVHAAIARLVAAAIARGELRANAADADAVNSALLGAAWLSFFYFALIAWVQGAHAEPAALVGRLIHQHLAGLRPPAAPPPRRKRRTSR
ncbi:MAG TPA: TetR/AcrR family transcriptional regulator [Kofleriaceae bacterium]|nr:TetR/AcrR family transcriptional regulator [Kofleriaceae bacterium]